jgi:hypothetical protein
MLEKELEIRKASNYKNENSTLFDFIMIYMKIWRSSCQLKIDNNKEWFSSTYKFFCDVETASYDFTKSILIDPECLKYKASFIVASLITVTIEILLR